MPKAVIEEAKKLLKAGEQWQEQGIVSDYKKRKVLDDFLWRTAKPLRALVIGDTHFPFHDTEAIEKALSIGVSRRCRVCVLLGDIWDMYSVSRFAKNMYIPLVEELELGKTIIEAVTDLFPYNVIIKANHEARLERYLAATITPEILDFLRANGNTFDVGEILTRGKKNTFALSEWCRIGDCYLSHREEFSSIPMRSVCNVDDYFQNHWEDTSPRCIVHAHTHHHGRMFRQGRLLIEPGTLCNYGNYALTGRAGPSRTEKWYRGCAVVSFDKYGKTIFEETETYFFGECKAR